MSQQKSLETVIAEVAQLRDGLGQSVEPGIFDAVVALRWQGFYTDSSCEGHPEPEGIITPSVTLSYPEPEDEWNPDEREVWAQQNLEQQQRIIQLLTVFYEQHNETPMDLRLIANSFGPYIVQLRPHGGEVAQLIKDQNEREKTHEKFLLEFQKFTRFLLGKK